MEDKTKQPEQKFYTISKELFARRDLTAAAKMVMVNIIDRIGSNGHCWPSLKTISDDLGMSRSAVQGAVDLLVDAGLVIRIQGQLNGPKAERSNRYSLTSEGLKYRVSTYRNPNVPESERTESRTPTYRNPVSNVPESGNELYPYNSTQRTIPSKADAKPRESVEAEDSILSQSADAINSLPGAPTPLKDPTGASVIDKPGYVEPDPADDPDSHVPPAVRELAREFMGKGSWKLISARQRGKVGQYIETSGAARVEQAFRELLRTDERALQAVGLRAADLCHEQTARPFTKPDQPAPRERKMKVV